MNVNSHYVGSIFILELMEIMRVLQNTLLFYVRNAPLKNTELMDNMNDKIETKSVQLATEHWEYIKDLLLTHKVPLEIVNLCGFHYQTAFIHGWKHGIEYLEESTNGY